MESSSSTGNRGFVFLLNTVPGPDKIDADEDQEGAEELEKCKRFPEKEKTSEGGC